MRLPINIGVVFPEGRDKMALNTNGDKVQTILGMSLKE